MESSEITLAENLKKNGYKTAYIGKWHLGDEAWYPEKQGYHENFGGCDYGQPPSFFDPYNNPKHKHPTIQAGIHKLPGRKPGEYLTHREADEAVKLIRQWKNQPFSYKSHIMQCILPFRRFRKLRISTSSRRDDRNKPEVCRDGGID